jgi:quercetin dioxygenase-like cupin family protein
MFLRGAGYISQGFPAPGLRRTVRHITGHDAEGRAVFLSTDCGDHHTIIGEQQALGNILYSTNETPVDMNNDKDLLHAKEHEPPLHYKNGTVVRMIDFAPGLLSPMHRSVSLDFGVVLEGEFELLLDSGEKRVMRQGDVSINRGGAHTWRNMTGNGTLPGRMLYVLIDSKPIVTLKGEELGEYLAELAPYYKEE